MSEDGSSPNADASGENLNLSSDWFLDDKPIDDAEIALLRSLARLTLGQIQEFYDPPAPPESIARWIELEASPGQIRGLLLAVLKRWNELR